MTITLNGNGTRFDVETSTVRGVLQAKAWSFPLIVVTVNGRLVDRADWDTAPVADGDVMDATHLMSGG